LRSKLQNPFLQNQPHHTNQAGSFLKLFARFVPQVYVDLRFFDDAGEELPDFLPKEIGIFELLSKFGMMRPLQVDQ